MSRLPDAIHVINLDAAHERLAVVTRGFDRYLSGTSLALNRFVAIDAAEVERRAIPGRMDWGGKACFASHAQCLQAAANRAAPVWIVEDDVVFGPGTIPRIEAALEILDGREWDILFTDISVTEPHSLVELFLLWRRRAGAGSVQVLDLREMAFAGTPSYLVNPRSVDKLRGLYVGCESLDAGVDIWMKKLAGSGQVICCCIFPFATTVATFPSQIRNDYQELTTWWTAFSRMLWDGDDPGAFDGWLDTLEQGFVEADAARAGRILAAMLSSRWANHLAR